MRSFAFGKSPAQAITGRQAILIALISFAVLIPYTSPGGVFTQNASAQVLQVDEGTVLYDSLRVAQGQVPYRDFFEFPGPVTFFFYGAVFRFFDPSLEAARWANITLVAMSAALVAIVASRLAGRIAAVAAAVLHTCAFFPSFPVAYTHWIAEVCGMAALVLIGTERPRKSSDLLGGALCATSLLTIQSVGLPLLAAAVGTVWVRGAARRDIREALRRPAFVLLGGAVVIGLAFFYFAMVGGLKQFIYCTWTWPLSRYAMAQGGGMEYGFALKDGINAHAALSEPLKMAAITTLKLIVAAPGAAVVAALVTTLWGLRAIIRRRPENISRLVIAAMSFAAVFPPVSGRTRADVTHLAFIASFGVVGVCVLLNFSRRRLVALRLGASALLVAATISAYAYGAKLHLVRPQMNYATFAEEFEKEYTRSGFLKTVHFELEPRLAPNDPIVVGLMSGYYYFFFQPSALRLTRLSNIPQKEYYTEAQIKEVAATIVQTRPKVIALWTDYQFNTITSRAPQLRSMYHPYSRNIWVLESWAQSEGLLKPKSRPQTVPATP